MCDGFAKARGQRSREVPSADVRLPTFRAMSVGAAVGLTIVLVLVAGATAGFWLNIVMWIPMLLLGRMRDEEQAFVFVSALSMLAAAVVVFVFGRLVMDLPVVAALIAGVLVGITSYARPNPGAYSVAEAYSDEAFDDVYDDGTRFEYVPERFVCSDCGKGLPSENGLAQHRAAKHGGLG